MNKRHLEVCASAEWADTVEKEILPWALSGRDLGDDVLEVGPGPGLTTDVLRRRVRQLTAVEVDDALASASTGSIGRIGASCTRATCVFRSTPRRSPIDSRLLASWREKSKSNARAPRAAFASLLARRRTGSCDRMIKNASTGARVSKAAQRFSSPWSKVRRRGG